MRGAEEMLGDATGVASICSLRTGPGLFGIDTRQVREVLGGIAPQRVSLAPEFIAGVVPYRGEVLTAVSFRALLGLERRTGASCLVVLDDNEGSERFGLMVDAVGGVVTMNGAVLEANPSALDVRGTALFDGVYRMRDGLMVRLDPRRLRPSHLAECGLFGVAKNTRYGEPR